MDGYDNRGKRNGQGDPSQSTHRSCMGMMELSFAIGPAMVVRPLQNEWNQAPAGEKAQGETKEHL